MRCTLPSRVGIAGFISQDARDPNFGYPFNTFVDCTRKSAWGATINVAAGDLPFLRGKAKVQVIAAPTLTGLQAFTTEEVVLVAR